MKKLVEYEKKDKEMNKHIISLRVFYPELLILVDILSAIGFSSFFRFYALWMTSLNISCWMKKLSLAGFNTKAWVNDWGGSSSVWKNNREKFVKKFFGGSPHGAVGWITQTKRSLKNNYMDTSGMTPEKFWHQNFFPPVGLRLNKILKNCWRAPWPARWPEILHSGHWPQYATFIFYTNFCTMKFLLTRF